MSSENSVSSTFSPASANGQQTMAVPDERPKRDRIADVLLGKDSPATQSSPRRTPAAAEAARPSVPSNAPDGSASKPGARPDTSSGPGPESFAFDDGDESDAASAAEARKFLKEFAKEHGISVKRAFGLMIETGDGDAVSVGQLADHWRENRQYQQERDSFEYDRAMMQNQLMAEKKQNSQMADRMRQAIGDEAFQRVFADIASEQRSEVLASREQLLQFFPRWADPVEMRAARDRLADFVGKRYGVARHEVAGMTDARAVKILEDFRLVTEKFEKLRAGSRELQATTQPTSTKKHQPNKDQRAQALADAGDKKGAIQVLLGG